MSKTKELQKPLNIDEIDFRVQSINNGKYATILAYKDARADMNRLDDVFGVFGWKREHTRDNKNCIVSVWDETNKQWVSKEDTGTESMAEKDKGLASDSFKRACFNLGIGRELYDYPIISIKLNDDEVTETGKPKPKYRGSFKLNIRNWKWESEFKDGKIISLSCKDTKGNVRYNWKVDSVNPEIPKGKPELKVGSTEFKKVLAAVKKGFTIEQVKTKYNVSSAVEKLLIK